jgi:hypothetical protein
VVRHGAAIRGARRPSHQVAGGIAGRHVSNLAICKLIFTFEKNAAGETAAELRSKTVHQRRNRRIPWLLAIPFEPTANEAL